MIYLLLGLLCILIAACCVGFFCFRFAIVRYKGLAAKHQEKSRANTTNLILRENKDVMEAGAAWLHGQMCEQVRITSYDGLRLTGYFLPNGDSERTIILMHGYRSTPEYDLSVAFRFFYEQGFNLLICHQRAHCKSEGKYICYGVKERFDCRDWARYLAERFGPRHEIALDGISMGASTVLMASGLDLPPQVKCVIADSGFTSPWEEIGFVIRHDYHLPPWPVRTLIDLFSKRFAGFGLREYSTLDAMAVNKLPVLFIHGEADGFVPCEMSRRAYAACRAEKRLVTVPGANHGLSILVDFDTVSQAVSDFLKTYCKGDLQT